ncbi:signal transduction histidine kinase [Algoriphagus ratkowskyi]|uniref:histidine kinase n=1 Tax=Algoriphagus ratkowskyi TaxID=57028 RepID=A0A2W7R1J4_9BACT|nr:two-component regulator propeller domain-containing protein [Algoriphagus ratkowskyi]PZX52110.1 signal transduction histidine kinase [Algoriphagus ratkowskyi]TXD76126.1 response regulator [Algoriphagus ratkowskyi]
MGLTKTCRKFLPLIFLLVLKAFFLCPTESYARQNDSISVNYKFSHFSSKNGLPQNSVLAIFQDEKGYLWMGTDNGLAKFDGFQFQTFLHNPSDSNSISSNVIRAIIADRHGHLWVGTEGGGVSIFDPQTDKFYSYSGAKGAGTKITSTKISSIILDQSGNIWIGTLGEGLYKVSSPKLDFKTLPNYIDNLTIEHFDKGNSSLKDDKIWTVYQGKSGQLYVGTLDGGGYYFNSENNKFLPIQLGSTAQNITSVKSFYEDTSGKLWLGTEKNGLWVSPTKENNFRYIDLATSTTPHGQFNLNITSIRAVGNNQIWVGTLGSGLYVLSTDGKVLSHFEDNPSDPYSLTGNSVYTTFQDRNNNIWLGMYSGEGLNKVNPTQQQFEHYRYDPIQNVGLASKMVKTILKDIKGNLWVGLFNGGVNILPAGSEKFEYFYTAPFGKLSYIHVQTIIQTRDEKIWVGTDGGGINVVTIETEEVNYIKTEPGNSESLSKNEVWALAEDSKGMIWVGMANGGGLNRLDRSSGKVKRYDSYPNAPSFDDIRTLLIDSKDNLWIGTYGGGLNKMNISTEDFEIFRNDPTNPNTLSNDIITSLLEDKNGNIWIGTSGGGLNRLNPRTSEINSMTVKDGLSSDNIKAILEDNSGQLWISTINGLSSLDIASGTFRNYTEEDGLQSNEFNLGSAFKDEHGKLYFGGTNGFNAFYPDKITPDPIPTQPVFTKLRVFNQEIHPGARLDNKVILNKNISYTKEIEFEYSQNNFEIEFSSLEFLGQNQIDFSYQLEGYDTDWINTTSARRFATYTNLPHGKYLFKVKALHENSLDSSPIAELHITILAPWHLTNWAFLLYAVLLLIVVYVYQKFIIWRIKLRNDLRFERLEKGKQEEINQLKLSFFTNISHELRTPLMLLNSPLEKLSLRQDLPDTVQKQLHSIHSNAKRLLRLINQLLDFRKQETGNLELQVEEVTIQPFLQQIFEAFEALAMDKKIKFQMKFDKNTPEKVWIDREQIQKVMFNLIYNAFKFTPEDGTITVLLESSDFIPPGKKESKPGILINVIDNGIGIPKENLAHVYESFYQIKREGQVYEAGTGIGLALSKSLVDLHFGVLDVSSENGLTTFNVYLQLGSSHFDEKNIHTSPQVEQVKELDLSLEDLKNPSSQPIQSKVYPINRPEMSDRKILVVEDNPELLELIMSNLEETFTVITATNGKEALLLIAEENPDLVISDVMMPEMDGIELCSKIKENINTSHLLVILLTAKSSHIHQLEGYESGADDYLVKPFQLDLLSLKVKNLLFTRSKFQSQFVQTPNLEPSRASYTSSDQKFLEAAMQTVEKNIDNTDFSVNDFVKELGLSRTLIFEKFKALSGLTPNDFIQTVRLKRAAQLMIDSDLKVAEISYSVGFSNPKYFSKCFLKQFGKTPSAYKKEVK